MPPKRAPQARAPLPAKRRRHDGDDDDNELSDSELSDIEDDLEEATLTRDDEDDDEDDEDDEDDDDNDEEEEEEEEEEEVSSDSDTPEGEVEESYISEGVPDISDEDSDMKTKPPAKGVAQRSAAARGGANRRTSSVVKLTAITKKPSAAKKVGKRTEAQETVSSPHKLRQLPPRNTQTRSTVGIGTRSSYPQQGKQTAATSKATTPTIRLKIGKDRLRDATSAWTPPPGATDTAAASTAAATPENIAAPVQKPAATSGTGPRGRKIVQEESDDEEDEDEDSREDEDDQEDDELNDEDAEGETDDEMLDSDDQIGNTPGTDFLSRTGTPDMSRLTNRQRTRLGDITTADLLELPSGFEKPGINKGITLSAHEQELKRAEMARRRKNLTDQKLEEEKIDTINRLLKKQTPKMRGRGRATGDATPADQNGDAIMGGVEPPPPPKMIRWVSNKSGIRLAVPDSWLTAPIGKRFEPQTETKTMRMVRKKLVEEL